MKKRCVKILTVVFCMLALACTFVVPSFAYCDDCEHEYNRGYVDGHKDGHVEGYDVGYADGEENANNGAPMLDSLREFIYAIFDAPATLINSMLDFNFFGINVASFVRTILTLVVVGTIVFVLVKMII